MHDLGISLRVVTVGDAARDQKAFSDIGGAQFVMDASDAAYAPDHEEALPTRPSAAPLVLLGCGLAVLLALAELLLPLRWRRGEAHA
jgi:hypothetical protein